MHWLRLVLFRIAPLTLAVAAPVLLLWAWGNGLALLPALLVGLLFLSAALIIYLVGTLHQPERAQEYDLLWAEISRLHEQVRQLSRTGASTSGQHPQALPAQQPDQPQPDQPQPEQSRQEPLRHAPSGQPCAVSSTPAAAPAAKHAEEASPSPDDLPAAPPGYALYMEPVQDAASRAVVSYRAMPALPAEEGRIFPARHAQIRARLTGVAGALQGHVLRDCLEFLHQLNARHALLPVICPLDAATLGQAAVAARLTRLLHAAPPEIRASLLLAVAEEDLAALGRDAAQRLLELDALVHGFVLDTAHVPEAQATLPLPLMVRHVDVPVSALQHLRQLSGGARRLQGLAMRGWRLIAHDVETEDHMATALQGGALARGRHVGLPRRMRLPGDAVGTAMPGTEPEEQTNAMPRMASAG